MGTAASLSLTLVWFDLVIDSIARVNSTPETGQIYMYTCTQTMLTADAVHHVQVSTVCLVQDSNTLQRAHLFIQQFFL